jgi:hypothetical protein
LHVSGILGESAQPSVLQRAGRGESAQSLGLVFLSVKLRACAEHLECYSIGQRVGNYTITLYFLQDNDLLCGL